MLRAEAEEYIRMGMRMLNKKHLEKAILFSLLLTNVCRLGGATEYNSPDQNHGDLRASGTVYDGMITGASSDDSTFSSIKQLTTVRLSIALRMAIR